MVKYCAIGLVADFPLFAYQGTMASKFENQ